MRAHYDGPGETTQKLANADADIKNLHYKNEHSLSFEYFINKLNNSFFIFSESEQPYTPVHKLNKMCENMNNSNTNLQAAMTVIKMNPDLKTPINEYFTKAENALSEQVAIIFPNERSQTSRYVSFADSGCGRGRGRGRNNSGGRGQGRGGRTHQSKQASLPANLGGNTGNTRNGIYISDLTRYFPRAQFISFTPELRTRIHHSKMTTTKRLASQVDVSDMQLGFSDVSDLRSGLAETRAVMQASRNNEPPPHVCTNASSSFGRSGQPPYKKTKGK